MPRHRFGRRCAALTAQFNAPPEAPIPTVRGSMEITAEVPANAKQLMITIFNRRQKLMKVLADAKPPRQAPGPLSGISRMTKAATAARAI